MLQTTQDEARALARAFLDLSHALGGYRFDHWDELGPDRRRSLEDLEWSLLNASSDVTTRAVGLVLDGVEGEVAAVRAATEQAKAIVAHLRDAAAVVELAARSLALAAALVTGNATAIGSTLQDIARAVEKALARG